RAAAESGLLISLSSLQVVRSTGSAHAAAPIAHRLVTGRLRDLWIPRGIRTKFEWTGGRVCKVRTDTGASTSRDCGVATPQRLGRRAINSSCRSGDPGHTALGYGSSATLNRSLVAPPIPGTLATSV